MSLTANQTLYAHWKGSYNLSFSPASVNIKESESQEVIISFTNDDFDSFYHNINSSNKIISAQWGTKVGKSIPLTITGLSAGSETVKISLLDESGGELYSDSFPVTVTAALKTYTVTFNAKGGSVSTNNKIVTDGSPYGTLPTPTRSRFTFDGWYTEISGGTKITESSIVSLTADQTLYAHWTPAAEQTPVDSNTPQIVIESQSAQVGKTVDIPISLKSNPGVTVMTLDVSYPKEWLTLTEVKDAKVLKGFASSSDYTQETYRLYWHDDEAQQNNTNSGVIATLTFQVNEAAPADNYPISVKDPYNGGGIYGVDGGQVPFILEQGKVTVNPPATYALTVESGSGSGQYAPGTPVTITANEPASGKRFKEWTGVDALTFIDGTSKTTATAKFNMPANPLTVTATYEDTTENEYSVTVNDGSGSGQYKESDSVHISANPAPDGQVFDKWLGAEGLTFTNGTQNSASATFTMPGNHVNLTATFRAQSGQNNQGCYVATSVYGSYDCPEVWTLRRFRDNVLAKTWYGRLFIRLYYAVSPTAVKLFGDCEWFQNFFRDRLDKMVSGLQADGFESTPYQDRAW